MSESTPQAAPAEPVVTAPKEAPAETATTESAPVEASAPTVNVENVENLAVHPSGGDQVHEDTDGVDDLDESEEGTS